LVIWWQQNLVQARGPDLISAMSGAHEHFAHLQMVYGFAGCIGYEILLRNISNIFGFGVFSKQVVERLVLVRPDLCGNG